jgi:hypothetical protein
MHKVAMLLMQNTTLHNNLDAFAIGMFISVVPNRKSNPTILLRETYREDGKVGHGSWVFPPVDSADPFVSSLGPALPREVPE